MRRMSWYLLLLMALPGVPCAQAAATCGPSLLGQPCATGGLAVASQAEPTLNLGAGNPIHIVSGNKYQQETDLPANNSAPGIEIVRHYNALDRRTSTVGTGWQLSYDTRLAYAGKRWQIIQADGSRVDFSVAAGKPTANRHGRLESMGKHWVWTWPTGRQLWFNASGHLVRLDAGRRLVLTIERNTLPGPLAETINKVSNHLGHTLSFSYRVSDGRAYLAHIDTPLGRFQYQHDAPEPAAPGLLRLTRMIRPDEMQRRYLYEPPLQAGNAGALTGIETVSTSPAESVRSNSWGYDDQGRAVLSVRGGPASQLGRISIRYVRQATPQQAGLTVVTDANQQETRFETAIHGGRFVLVSVSGSGCTGCAPVGSMARYDHHGRLIVINGTRLQREATGHIRKLAPYGSGWPGLTMFYGHRGRRDAWQSATTGTDRIVYNKNLLPAQRIWANGDSVRYHYDALRRPVRLLEQNKDGTLETTLRWRGARLTHIGHPNETESRQYNRAGRLIRRQLARPSGSSGTPLRYTESFEYDARHRLTRHHLPEGGALAYRWGHGSRLLGIAWHDAQGAVHTVIESASGNAGYCHGNGLCLLTTEDSQGQASQLAVYQGDRAIWSLAHTYDRQGRLHHEHHQFTGQYPAISWRYAYDARSRLAAAQGGPPPNSPATTTDTSLWYAWNDDGSLASKRSNGVTHRPSISRDASGLPVAFGDAALEYGPNRRLATVHRPGNIPIRFRHDAFGHRIAQHDGQDTIHYFYLGDRLVAESRPGPSPAGLQAEATPAITRRYIYAHHVPVAFIDYPSQGAGSAQLFAVHADFLGAPRLVTDASRALRWLASYSPTGAATRVAGDLNLDLRLPGQVFDHATGWHDNVMRTYVPEAGQYLEPDPLGPIPGNQAFGYADQQPRRYIDPLGLVLFAFDGTRNGPETLSNVWKLGQAYTDGPVYYHSGPGNSMYLDWDGATGQDAPQIIENQWQSLLNALEHTGSRKEHVPIDIIGYSRGAALARHFGNLINQHTRNGLFSYRDASRPAVSACIDLRFMGLFDTVAQFGIAGLLDANYDLTIAPAWAWVAHAIALHERRWLYPLTIASDSGGYNIVEAPFIGAHADIGGGAARTDDGQPSVRGDLADVTLNWMLWQARAASLRFDTLAEGDREITDPVLHDGRSSIVRSLQNGDRRIDQANGSLLLTYQDDHDRLGRNQRAATETMIARPENWRALDTSEVGTVDMTGYAQWLHDELGWQAVPS